MVSSYDADERIAEEMLLAHRDRKVLERTEDDVDPVLQDLLRRARRDRANVDARRRPIDVSDEFLNNRGTSATPNKSTH